MNSPLPEPRSAKDDAATVFVTAAAEEQTTAPIEETTTTVTVPVQPSPAKPAPGNRPNDLSGRIGVDYTVQDDREPVNYDYTQPALSVRATLRRISGSDFTAKQIFACAERFVQTMS